MDSIGNIHKRLASSTPLGVGEIKFRLDVLRWTGTILLMAQKYFPDDYDIFIANLPRPFTYQETITRFYKLVEGNDWFRVDWGLLEYFLEIFEEIGSSISLHVPIYHIPLEVYGEWRTEDVRLAPVVRALENSLLDTSKRPVIIRRLEHIWQYPDQYPSQVTLLPHIARWVTYEFDNLILSMNPLEPTEHATWPMWSLDLLQIRIDWEEARPILEVIDRLRIWGQSPENVQKLVRFIETGEGVGELDYHNIVLR